MVEWGRPRGGFVVLRYGVCRFSERSRGFETLSSGCHCWSKELQEWWQWGMEKSVRRKVVLCRGIIAVKIRIRGGIDDLA